MVNLKPTQNFKALLEKRPQHVSHWQSKLSGKIYIKVTNGTFLPRCSDVTQSTYVIDFVGYNAVCDSARVVQPERKR